MKAKVSNKLTGTIVLASVSRRSLVAGQDFDLTDDQFFSDEVQSAIQKGWVTVKDAPKRARTITVTNISLGSVSIPNVGVLRSGKSVEMKTALAESGDVERLLAMGKIVLGKKGAAAPEQPKSKMLVHEATPAPETEPVEEKPQKKAKPKKTIKKVGGDLDDMMLDTSRPAMDGSDEEPIREGDVLWVDHEESQRRLASHPILSKKQGNK